MLLEAIGEDIQREGLQETPKRFARFWAEFINYEPGDITTTFEAVTVNQMVVVSGIRVWSLCEHHLLPFWCDIAMGYIALDRVLGLSKFARIAHDHAHKLQVQERLVTEIADTLTGLTQSEDVAVLATGEHLCMTMRGIKTPALMKSSVMRGEFLQNADVRHEFLTLALG